MRWKGGGWGAGSGWVLMFQYQTVERMFMPITVLGLTNTSHDILNMICQRGGYFGNIKTSCVLGNSISSILSLVMSK